MDSQAHLGPRFRDEDLLIVARGGYAKGFLRNRPGFGYARVKGLEPGGEYVWKVYQFASLVAGKNRLYVNGRSMHTAFRLGPASRKRLGRSRGKEMAHR